MRVLIVCGNYPKVSETFITSHINGLVDRGHEVTVLTRGRLDRQRANALHEGQPVRFRDAQPDHGSPVPLRIARRYARALTHPRNTLQAIGYGRVRDRIKLSDLHACITLDRERRAHGEFDIAHAHFGIHGLWTLRIDNAMRLARARVVTFHGFDVWSVPQRVFDGYAWMRRQRVSFTANSLFTKERLIDLGFDERRIFLWRMGLRSQLLDEIDARPRRTPAPDGTIRILSCGRLAPVKGHDDLIRGVARVARACPHRLELSIIGGGSRESVDRLKGIIRDEQAEDFIKLLGALPNEVVLERMREADLFALTSKEDPHGAREAFGVVFLEASANGLPILATRSGGIPEAVLDGHTGLLAEENNVDDIAAKLTELIARRDEWPVFGSNGRAYVREYFSTDRTMARLIKLYERMLSA